MSADDLPEWLTAQDLYVPLGRLLGGEVASIDTWDGHALAGGQGKRLGVWWLTGHAVCDGMEQPWNLVLKGWQPAPVTRDPAAWDWPYREARAYTSGALNVLPDGIRAPRCLGHLVRPDGSEWIWLAAVTDGLVAWTLDHFARAAWHLGRFSGAYLAGAVPLPDHPWLSRQWTRQKVEVAEAALDQFGSLQTHPIVGRAFPPDVTLGITRLWDRRQDGLDGLEALPQTFCHLDAFRRNMFLHIVPDGSSELTLIDWANSGIASVGEDITPLVVASVFFLELPADQIPDLSKAVLDSYVAGLRHSGWTGDEAAVRAGYLASISLRWGLGSVGGLLPFLMNAPAYPAIESNFGRPMEGIADNLAAAFRWILSVADAHPAR